MADYYGQIVAKAPVSDEAILYADLDLAALEDHRRIWPFFRDRRIDSYGGITERWGKVTLWKTGVMYSGYPVEGKCGERGIDCLRGMPGG